MIALALRRKPNRILVEDAGTGTALVAELRRQGVTIISIRPEKGKVRHMSVQSVSEAFRQGAGQIGFDPDQDRPGKVIALGPTAVCCQVGTDRSKGGTL